MKKTFSKPFDGEISRFFEKELPKELRARIEDARKNEMLDPDYPYKKRMDKGEYESDFEALQIELAKMQRWLTGTKERVVMVFEGRDAAGKGGTIKRLALNLNPRVARVVALSKPSDRERGQWYFQRYIAHLPTSGEMTIFDRSWYNRAGVEPVMGFAEREEVLHFFNQSTEFERMLVEDGIVLMKFW